MLRSCQTAKISATKNTHKTLQAFSPPQLTNFYSKQERKQTYTTTTHNVSPPPSILSHKNSHLKLVFCQTPGAPLSIFRHKAVLVRSGSSWRLSGTNFFPLATGKKTAEDPAVNTSREGDVSTGIQSCLFFANFVELRDPLKVESLVGPVGQKRIITMLQSSMYFEPFEPFEPGSKLPMLGMVIPPLIGILIMGPYKPLLLG